MTIVEQNLSAEDQPAGTNVSPKEKKSVLKKVTEKAKSKVKMLGSKLKSPSNKGHDNEEKQELLERLEEEEDQSPAGMVHAKDLDVPLDEYEMIKKKEAENKDDEASAKEGSLGAKVTDGLPPISLAEQEPTDVSPADALHAVPTEYHYKENKSEAEPNKVEEPQTPETEDYKDPALFFSEENKLEEAGSEADKVKTDDKVDEPTSFEQREENVERSWPEEDFTLKTHGTQSGGSEEELPTPKFTPSEGDKEVGDGTVSSEDRGLPSELSEEKNEEVDVEKKNENEDEERAVEKVNSEAQGRELGHDDGGLDVKPQDKAKDEESFAVSKVEDEGPVNTANLHDEVPEKKNEDENKRADDLETDGKPEFVDERSIDRNDATEPVEAGERDVSDNLETHATQESEPVEGEADERSTITNHAAEPVEAEAEERSTDTKQHEVIENSETEHERSADPQNAKENPVKADELEIRSREAELPEQKPDEPSESTETDAGGDIQHAKKDTPEEQSKTSTEGHNTEENEDEVQSREEVSDDKTEEVEAKDTSLSNKRETEASPSPSFTQKLSEFKDSITSKLGYSATSAPNDHQKAEQERIVDEKAKEMFKG